MEIIATNLALASQPETRTQVDSSGSPDPICGAISGPVTVTVHGYGDEMLLPLVTLASVPPSGTALEAHARACLAALDLLAGE